MKKNFLFLLLFLIALTMVKDYIIPTIIVAFFILLLLSLSQKIKLFYKVKDIPISKIQSAPQGIVALSGSLINEKNQLYESPVGGQACNYWKVEISEISKNTRSKIINHYSFHCLHQAIF